MQASVADAPAYCCAKPGSPFRLLPFRSTASRRCARRSSSGRRPTWRSSTPCKQQPLAAQSPHPRCVACVPRVRLSVRLLGGSTQPLCPPSLEAVTHGVRRAAALSAVKAETTASPCASREGTGEETGGEIWDPLSISDSVSDEALMWFRHAELKHGRAAMVRPLPSNFPSRLTSAGLWRQSHRRWRLSGVGRCECVSAAGGSGRGGASARRRGRMWLGPA